MTERIKVWPKPGLKIRDEYSGQFISESGDEVPNTHLTAVRLRDGDLLTKDPRSAAPKKGDG
jgi:hypothetical protein